MTETQKKEFLAVLIKDYGVQIGKEDEILPILHLMYQMVYQHKGIVAQQEETIKGFEQLLKETKTRLEILSAQVQQQENSHSVPSSEGALKFLGIPLRLRILVLMNVVVLFLLLLGLLVFALWWAR
ncbi:hypothetical protein V9K67_10525 [Paraflavisolibacter sp. H34]|uniref:hypothetical protein n=1 Tax=Huijunlia imazamoxiresistens TaxID=3127457 RepID=UPI003016F353